MIEFFAGVVVGAVFMLLLMMAVVGYAVCFTGDETNREYMGND